MKLLSTIIFLTLCFWFGNGVTIQYAWQDIEWRTGTRMAMVIDRKPFYETVLALNMDGRITPDTVVFQSGFHEYRAWCRFTLIGRRMWNDSWHQYRIDHHSNTAKNLHGWLLERDADYLWVKQGDVFEVPVWSADFEEYFREAVVQYAWTGEITIMYEVMKDES